MMKFVIFLFVITIPFSACNTARQYIGKSGNTLDDALQVALSDFWNTNKLVKVGSTFSVEIHESLYDRNMLVIRIGKNNRKLLLTRVATIGSRGVLPSRYVEKNGKLFFWWDDKYALTEDALAIYRRYQLLQDDNNGAIKIPDFVIEDAEKAAHYYFCKINISIYKRVITNKGVGYYTPANIKCNSTSN